MQAALARAPELAQQQTVSAPTYRWSCYHCKAPNQAHIEYCAECGSPAEAREHDLAAKNSQEESKRSTNNQPSLLLFFPEIIPAAIAVLCGPFWGVRLALDGYYPQGIGILLVAIVGGLGFGRFIRIGNRWAAWFVVAAIIFSVLGIDSLLPKEASVFGMSSSQQNCEAPAK